MTRPTKPKYDINFRVRSVALVTNDEHGRTFEVLCYGWTHSDLASVSEDPTIGGQGLLRRLDRRGIDTDRWRANLFQTGGVTSDFDEGGGNTPRHNNQKPTRVNHNAVCLQGRIL